MLKHASSLYRTCNAQATIVHQLSINLLLRLLIEAAFYIERRIFWWPLLFPIPFDSHDHLTFQDFNHKAGGPCVVVSVYGRDAFSASSEVRRGKRAIKRFLVEKYAERSAHVTQRKSHEFQQEVDSSKRGSRRRPPMGAAGGVC
jgi:hypothetical protein